MRQRYPGIETVIIDLDAPETLPKALIDVTKVFLILGNVEHPVDHSKSLIDAAKASENLQHIVLYSVVGAKWEAILFAKQFR